MAKPWVEPKAEAPTDAVAGGWEANIIYPSIYLSLSLYVYIYIYIYVCRYVIYMCIYIYIYVDIWRRGTAQAKDGGWEMTKWLSVCENEARVSSNESKEIS